MNKINEGAEDWINLMYGREAAKKSPELRKLFEERLAPETLRVVDQCTNYEDFQRRLEQYGLGGKT